MSPRPPAGRARAIRQLIDIGARFDARRWVAGTSGNFSAVVHNPEGLVLTASGAHKGRLTPRQFVRLDRRGTVQGGGTARPSAEAALHLAIVESRGAGAVLHTHSVWGTILSDSHAAAHGLMLEDLEMLKGLSGVTTHAHQEWVPIVENDQDMGRLATAVRALLGRHAGMHGFLLRGHGLYTWGASIEEAERHVEIFEFLFEVLGRRHSHGGRHDS